MSSPLNRLRRLVAESTSTGGRVLSVKGGKMRVATTRGVMEVTAVDGVRAGDTVTIRYGQAVKKQVAEGQVFTV